MWGSEVFQRFLDESPMCVMARATLERVFAPARLDAMFQQVAQEQYERELLFSTLVDLMSLAVCRVHPSVHAVYQRKQEAIGVSVKAVYDKLAHVEPQTSRGLVQHTADEARALMHSMRGGCTPLLAGYQVKIPDGNHLRGTDHRLKELRNEGGRSVAGTVPGAVESAVADDRGRDPLRGCPCSGMPPA